MFRNFVALTMGVAICGVALADPPAEPATPTDTTSDATADIYVYASHGQTDKQLDRDRYECRRN